MKYENLEAATDLCLRIKELKRIEALIDPSDGRKCINLSHRWDGASSIIKDWSDNPFDKNKEEGMFTGEIAHFIFSCQRNIQQRIERLEQELAEL